MKAMIEIEADLILEAATEIIAEPGDRIVVVKSKAVAVLPAAKAAPSPGSPSIPWDMSQHIGAAPALPSRPRYSLPSRDAVYAAIEREPRTTRELNRDFGFGREDGVARNYVKNRVHSLLTAGLVRARNPGRFPIYEATKPRPATD